MNINITDNMVTYTKENGEEINVPMETEVLDYVGLKHEFDITLDDIIKTFTENGEKKQYHSIRRTIEKDNALMEYRYLNSDGQERVDLHVYGDRYSDNTREVLPDFEPSIRKISPNVWEGKDERSNNVLGRIISNFIDRREKYKQERINRNS